MIFKCLECDILKFRKPLSEFRKVAFCFVPKTKFRKTENHFRNIRKTYSIRIRRRNSENKKPMCCISDIIFSISEIHNHILQKLKTNTLFQNFWKCRSDFKKLFSFFFNFCPNQKVFFRYSKNIFLFYKWNF